MLVFSIFWLGIGIGILVLYRESDLKKLKRACEQNGGNKFEYFLMLSVLAVISPLILYIRILRAFLNGSLVRDGRI